MFPFEWDTWSSQILRDGKDNVGSQELSGGENGELTLNSTVILLGKIKTF